MIAPTNRPAGPDDGDEVRAFLAGDAGAFERLVDRHQRAVLRLCQRLLDSTEDARDLFQDVLLQVFRSLAQLREPEAFRTWMFRITVRRARRMQHPRPWERSGADPDGIAGGRESDPLEHREAVDQLHAHLARLPPRQREVVVLRHFENLRFGEISEVLDIREEAARASHYQGLRRLRRWLEAGEGR